MFEGQNIHLSPVDGKKLCSFSRKICKQRRLNGYAFCVRHILEDSHAPFKQCQFKTKHNGEKCINSVPIGLDRIYCMNHLQVMGLAPKKVAPLKKAHSKPPDKSKCEANIRRKLKPLVGKNADKINISLKNKKNEFLKKRQLSGDVSREMKGWQENVSRKISNAYYKAEVFRQGLSDSAKLVLEATKEDGTGSDEDLEVQFDLTEMFQKEILDANESVANNKLVVASPSSQQKKLLRKIKHQYGQLKESIAHSKRSNSCGGVSRLIETTRLDPIELMNVLKMRDSSVPTTVKRVPPETTSYKIPCCLVDGNKRCTNLTLPYMKYCPQHSYLDHDQQLFVRCTDKHVTRTKCPGSVLLLLNDHLFTAKRHAKRSASKASPRVSKKQKSASHQPSLDDLSSSSDSQSDSDMMTPDEDHFVMTSFPSRLDDDDSLFRNVNCDLDDDDLMRCANGGFSFESKASRELSSPTLNQLSTSDFDVTFNALMTQDKALGSDNNPMSASFLSSFDRDVGQQSDQSSRKPALKISPLATSTIRMDAHNKDARRKDAELNRQSYAQPVFFQDKSIFETSESETMSPLEKVNPDIFFSSVFPLSTDQDV